MTPAQSPPVAELPPEPMSDGQIDDLHKRWRAVRGRGGVVPDNQQWDAICAQAKRYNQIGRTSGLPELPRADQCMVMSDNPNATRYVERQCYDALRAAASGLVAERDEWKAKYLSAIGADSNA